MIQTPNRRKWCLAAVSLLTALLCLVLLLCRSNRRIPPDTHIAGCNVGGMTRQEAREALSPLAQRYSREPMVVNLPQASLQLLPEQTNIALDVAGAVKAAFAIGETGTDADRREPAVVSLAPYIRCDESAIRETLEAYAEKYDTDLTESRYRLEGSMPELQEPLASPVCTQTLVLETGTPARKLDIDQALQQILQAYHQSLFSVTVDAESLTNPRSLDLDAIHRELSASPQDAVLDLEQGVVLPAVYGYGFDLEAARQQLQVAQPGDRLSIPMETIAPGRCSEDLYFQDVLGSYVSGHSTLGNITNNLQLICRALDGIVLQPGEVFSYNDALGERTVERGYLYGPSFSGMEESRSPGGGVCQGSSVLHVCVLEADLEVVERVSHGMPVGYTPLGQDAAVSWGGPDFRFRNTTRFPIRIVAEYRDNDIRFQLLGTDEKDYYIQLEATRGEDAYQVYASCYKRKYSKATGELISRELALRSAYSHRQ